jgi:hypothetical protein
MDTNYKKQEGSGGQSFYNKKFPGRPAAHLQTERQGRAITEVYVEVLEE